ncbi:MAG: TlpA family protein disulfide reductase, partial [Chryseobacterium sp.]
YSRLNIKSIDIKLNDLNGVPFSLSEQRGKSVVLYFFRANSEDEEQLAKHRYFDQLVRKYESHKNIVFVAIDKTSAYDTDDSIRNKVRLGILKNYLEKYDLKFRVLLDDYHYNSKNSGLTYFRVADDYSSDWSSQFYLIDKKGMVRYKSYIIPGGFKGFSRDFSKSLKIID